MCVYIYTPISHNPKELTEQLQVNIMEVASDFHMPNYQASEPHQQLLKGDLWYQSSSSPVIHGDSQ